MGSELSRLEGDLPLSSTNNSNSASSSISQTKYFSLLHETLTKVSKTLLQNSETQTLQDVLNLFTPPQDISYEGQKQNIVDESFSEFFAAFPSSKKELQVIAIEVGAIQIQSSTSSSQRFQVKIQLDGTLLDFGFKKIPLTNSFYLKLNSISFDLMLATPEEEPKKQFDRISKSKDVIDCELVIKREGEEGSGSIISTALKMQSALIYDTENIQLKETVPVSRLLEYLMDRVTIADYNKVSKFQPFSSENETTEVLLQINRLYLNDIPTRWCISCRQVQFKDEKLHTLLNNDNKYVVEQVNTKFYTMEMIARSVEPHDEVLSVYITSSSSSSTALCRLLLRRPVDRRREGLPSWVKPAFQDLRMQPMQSIGNCTFNANDQESSVDVPPFLKNHCHVSIGKLVTLGLSASNGTTIVQAPILYLHLDGMRDQCNASCLSLEGMKNVSSKPTSVSAKLHFADRNQLDTSLLVFRGEVHMHQLSQELTCDEQPVHGLVYLGQLLLDKAKVFTWKPKNHSVPTATLQQFRRYTILTVKSKMNFVTQRFEIQFELIKEAPESKTNCTMVLDFENKIMTITDKDKLNFEMEFGIGETNKQFLPELLWSQTIENVQHQPHQPFTDITVLPTSC